MVGYTITLSKIFKMFATSLKTGLNILVQQEPWSYYFLLFSLQSSYCHWCTVHRFQLISMTVRTIFIALWCGILILFILSDDNLGAISDDEKLERRSFASEMQQWAANYQNQMQQWASNYNNQMQQWAFNFEKEMAHRFDNA